MKLILKEAINPNHLYIERSDVPGVKQVGFTKEELLAPLAIENNETTGQPADKRVVRALKIGSGNIQGFTSWEQARDWLDAIADVTPLLTQLNLTVEEVLQ
jgi:hypothetical protein